MMMSFLTRRSCSFGGTFDRFLLLGLLLLLSSAHLVVVVDVAALALALCVVITLPCMDAVSCHCLPPILMVAMIAHAHRVQRQIRVLAGRDGALLAPEPLLLGLWICLAVLAA